MTGKIESGGGVRSSQFIYDNYSLLVKLMKQRTFQACSLKHSIKKGMFYVQSKLNFFKSGRGGTGTGYASDESY